MSPLLACIYPHSHSDNYLPLLFNYSVKESLKFQLLSEEFPIHHSFSIFLIIPPALLCREHGHWVQWPTPGHTSKWGAELSVLFFQLLFKSIFLDLKKEPRHCVLFINSYLLYFLLLYVNAICCPIFGDQYYPISGPRFLSLVSWAPDLAVAQLCRGSSFLQLLWILVQTGVRYMSIALARTWPLLGTMLTVQWLCKECFMISPLQKG